MEGLALFGVAIGMGIASLGTGLSIGLLASKSVESIARQPEASGTIRGAMILAIAFIEAIALYMLVISILIWTKG